MRKLLLCFIIVTNILTVNAQTPCTDGIANGYPCNQIDFYSQIDNNTLSGTAGVSGNDIWGWTDPESGIEYVIMGQTNGTVFVDISNLTSPKIVGRLPSHQGKSSAWRDIKVFNNHVFIVADNNSGHGMQIFDLTRLRSAGNTIETYEEDAHYDGVSSAHNVVINQEKGYVYIVGARGAGNGCGAGGLHIVDISNPKTPVFAGCFDADGYTHDAQVVTYAGPDEDYLGKQISFNSNENTITIANVDDPTKTSLISKQGYESSAYAHQGWLTEDHQYFISNDELDETDNKVGATRTLIWDVRDLDSPTLINAYYSERKTIDHNLYTHEGKVFQSNYENGLVILDGELIGDGKMREIAYFDTFPNSNSANFNGTWSNYPYFKSGVVAISDINRGLFIVKPNLKSILISHPKFNGCGSVTSMSVGVNSEANVQSYQWQSVEGSSITNLSDNEFYNGTTTAELNVDHTKITDKAVAFRCKVKLLDGSETISFPTNSLLDYVSTPKFTYSNDGFLVQFSSTSSNVDTYLWDFGDGSAPSTEQEPVHIYEQNGIYNVKLTTSNSCGESVYEAMVDLSASVTATRSNLDKSIKVFPIPTKNQLNIVLDDSLIEVEGVSIYSAKGTLIYQGEYNGSYIINTSDWQKGLYFAIFDIKGNQQFSKKIIKD